MSDERHETVADIMSEMREYADNMEKHLLYDLRECATDYLRVLADRIEAAVMYQFREVAKMIPHEEVAVSKMETTTPTGNTAAMREALEAAIPIMRACLFDYYNTTDVKKVVWEMKAALSAPPRNCDVGTAEEQAKRFKSFCKTHLSGIRSICSTQCPCVGCRSMFHCLTKWAQMPYEAGGAK